MDIKFPHISVPLVGHDGNAFAIMGSVTKAMRRGGCSPQDIEAYRKDAMSGDYDHLLQVTMQTVETSVPDDGYEDDESDDDT